MSEHVLHEAEDTDGIRRLQNPAARSQFRKPCIKVAKNVDLDACDGSFLRPRARRTRRSDETGCHASASSRRPTFGRRGFGMTTSGPNVDPRAIQVTLSEDDLTVDLADGRRVSVPLAWFPRLLHADSSQSRNWYLMGDGQGIHWPDLDEDLSVAGLLCGTAAPGAIRKAG